MTIVHLDANSFPAWAPDIAVLGTNFFREAQLPGVFAPGHFVTTFHSLLNAGVAGVIIAVDDDKVVGAIGGVVTQQPFTGQRVAIEQFWFVDADHRRSGVGHELLAAYERWAVASDVEAIVMVHLLPGHDRLRKLYESRGYRPLETSYIMTINHDKEVR